MKTRFARSIAFFACIHLLGGHWLALQMVAWTGMLVVHSQDASLSAALEKTFDGQHPCSLCAAVESGQEQENKEALVDTSHKIAAVLFVALKMPPRPPSALVYFSGFATSEVRLDAPPSPPPRHV